MAPNHEHLCNCGAVVGEHHIGAPGCLRNMETDAPASREARFQYLYYQHLCGCWSSTRLHDGIPERGCLSCANFDPTFDNECRKERFACIFNGLRDWAEGTNGKT